MLAPPVEAQPAPAPAPLGGGVTQGFANAPTDDKAEDSTTEASGDTDASYNAAMAAYRDGRYSEAQRRFAGIASQGGAHAAAAALYEVQALRMVSGCPTAAPRFEDIHSRYPGAIGSDAAWQAADCFRSLGELSRARQDYQDLMSDANYKARAQDAIAELDLRASDQELAARKAAAALAKGKSFGRSFTAGSDEARSQAGRARVTIALRAALRRTRKSVGRCAMLAKRPGC